MTRLVVSHTRMGFHWAPFNSIEHLHLHLLYPVEQMSLISRLVFMPNYFWFSEVRRAHETLMNDDYLMTIDLQPLRFFLFNTAGRKDSRVSEGENRSCRSQLGAFDFISMNHTCRWLVAQINDRLATASLAVIAHAIAIAESRVPTGSNRHINSGACQGARRGENPILRVSDWADVCVFSESWYFAWRCQTVQSVLGRAEGSTTDRVFGLFHRVFSAQDIPCFKM